MTIEFVDAWRKGDPKLEADALAFWQSQNVKLETPDGAERLKMLAMLAYEDNKVIGLSTLNIRHSDQVRQKMAFIREIVAIDHRRKHLGIDLAQKTREMIETYAFNHQDEQIAGMAAVLQGVGIGKHAISRGGQMILAGYTANNEQFRVAWFAHYQVPANLATR
ncbi:MAG: hypothetical protein ACOH12_03140 [Parvibaculaceae bacterium]